MLTKLNKKAQEELVGFALIIIVVAVVILFLLAFSLRSQNKASVESYEVDSFIQTSLQYTTDCDINERTLSLQDLILSCSDKELCSDNKTSCQTLNSTLTGLSDAGWKTGENAPVKGYELVIKSNQNDLLDIKQGNITKNYKGGLQSFAKGGDYVEFSLKVYY